MRVVVNPVSRGREPVVLCVEVEILWGVSGVDDNTY